jgi:hypothetical protein
MLILDNFLPNDEFKQLQDYITGSNFPWYYHSHASAAPGTYIPENSVESGAMVHSVFSKEDNSKSFALEHFAPLLNKIDEHENFQADFIRVRTGMKTVKPGFTDKNYNLPHVDYRFPHTTALLYVTESDGDTWMFDEQYTGTDLTTFTVKNRISPKPNRLIIFDGLCYHTASNPINSDVRIIVNINYVMRNI